MRRDCWRRSARAVRRSAGGSRPARGSSRRCFGRAWCAAAFAAHVERPRAIAGERSPSAGAWATATANASPALGRRAARAGGRATARRRIERIARARGRLPPARRRGRRLPGASPTASATVAGWSDWPRPPARAGAGRCGGVAAPRPRGRPLVQWRSDFVVMPRVHAAPRAQKKTAGLLRRPAAILSLADLEVDRDAREDVAAERVIDLRVGVAVAERRRHDLATSDRRIRVEDVVGAETEVVAFARSGR